ncbi:MAG: GNAT family N-acetyltransferase [Eubacteriales bacterium]|nr:GNAT family N-acetyltransferase [Eubacteriales bacterium]
MNIRFAKPSDIPGLLDLLAQVGEVHHQLRPDIFRAGAMKYDRAALERLLTMPDRPIFVADMDGAVAGYAFCILQITENDPVLRDRRVLYLDDLCVDEGHRGAGIATALYAAVTAHARALHCDAVTLNVWSGNDGARKFYEQAGLHPLKVGMEAVLC